MALLRDKREIGEYFDIAGSGILEEGVDVQGRQVLFIANIPPVPPGSGNVSDCGRAGTDISN